MYKLGDRLFCNKEYKTILLSVGVTIVCGIAFFFMYPVIHRFVMIDLLEVDPIFRSDSFVIMEDAARMKTASPASPDPHMSMVLSRATDFPETLSDGTSIYIANRFAECPFDTPAEW